VASAKKVGIVEYICARLRYNSPPLTCNPMERVLQHSVEAVSEKLAQILTDYLSNNWGRIPEKYRHITPSTNMVTQLQLDSFQVMEFMLEVEDNFDVAIDLESLSDVHTVRDLAAVVIAAHAE
jgi:acyl carrier protein